jgi:hypothetical protein
LLKVCILRLTKDTTMLPEPNKTLGGHPKPANGGHLKTGQ